MFEINLWCYLWDLLDNNIDDTLDRLQGEAGITGISVAVNYHSLDHLRSHPGQGVRRFQTAGGLQYQPTDEAFLESRMRPVIADWLAGRNPLDQVADACARRGLKMRAWTVCCHCDFAAEHYFDFAVRNVFGDADPTWLCPVNPDVRGWLHAIIRDLGDRYPFDAFELERPSFQDAPHVHMHEKHGVHLGPVGEWLSNLCFCASCRQKVREEDINVDEVVRVAQQTLISLLDDDASVTESCQEFARQHHCLEEFVEWRCRQVTSLVDSLRKAARTKVVVHRGGDRYTTGTDWLAINRHCDATLTNLRKKLSDEAVTSTAEAAKADMGDMFDMRNVELGYWPIPPYCRDSATLVSSMVAAARLGIRSVNIYNYGILPIGRLDWIKQAARYAQRET